MAKSNTPFHPNKIALALAIAGCTSVVSVSAQETAETKQAEERIEVIEVKGSFRDSLSNALNQKRQSDGAIDAILAEDIADFPDLNLAESLQRIPGIAISRAAGEGRQISVRGLGPEFTRVRINGMEAVSTSGGTDQIGGANRGRGFDFNTFSSDLFSSLTVRKTASADVEEGSLGATVDLRAAQPFDYDGFTFAASGQMGYNDLSEKSDPKTSFLVSNIFADGKVGALFSASYSERQLKDQGASTVRWNNVNDFGSYQGDNAAPELDEINNAFRPRLPRYDSYTHDMDRLGLSSSFQFRPNEDTKIDLDVLYAKTDATRNEVFLQGILNAGANRPTSATAASGNTGVMNVVDYFIDDTNTMTYGSFENATIRAENRFDELSTEFLQYNLSLKQHLTDDLSMDAMIGTAKSEFDNPVQTTLVAEKRGVEFAYDYRGGNRESPALTYGAGVFDPTGWTSNSVRLRPLGAENSFDTAELNFTYLLTDNITLKAGLHYKDFSFETYEARRQTENGAGIVYTPDLLKEYNSGLGSQPVWLVPDFAAIDAQYDIYSNTGAFVVSADFRRPDNYSAEEETLGAYLQLGFDTDIADMPLRGNIGLRQVNTDQSSTAWATFATTPTQITAEHDYNELLPSLNLALEPWDDVIVRFGAAEVMARAGLGSIRPDVSVSVSGGSRAVSGGNPQLEPTKAQTYDLGFEFYFSDESMLGVAFFFKDIDSHVQTLRETKAFTATGLPIQAAIDACTAGPGYNADCNENVDWQVTTPLNGPGGDLKGMEVSYQLPFTFLPEFWNRFGFIGNYTYVDAQMDYISAAGVVQATRDLNGLSKNTSAATIYYEHEALNARVSMAKRGKYLTTAIGRDNNDMEGTNATTNVDASVSYALNDNWKISFEALNLTDEVDDQWVDSAGNRLTYYHETGRQYYLGAQYKF
ncbi:TonB-dependent receptor [Rheinheimera tangshanensis]|jgi:TonB-dependent receptor|uniref:TonB-dependent receptor n=1 Tax=Rheinheimera tangshanensis TaxID=400153 RepID=A0A5C8M6D8_9GAMM|nr:TonB-dependent receptor [Rheinheimera tangshanensis]TXK82950.1 TonB-dependent receptor [Rheinheimera tangshanensis]GGM47568.1 TonB-dependent receptor [Rheinheimera tangshanensis]